MSTTLIAVEHGVPRPGHGHSGHRKYPFDEMSIDDSFFVPHTVANISAVRASAADGKKRTGYRFSILAVEGGTRVWRIE